VTAFLLGLLLGLALPPAAFACLVCRFKYGPRWPLK
jgi:hypothetical protein